MFENEKWINIPEQGKGKIPVPYQKFSFDMNDDWKSVTFDHMIAVAPNGGPIAIARKHTKFYATSGNLGKHILVYSGIGQKIAKFLWPDKETLIYMGWTIDENLLCLTRKGRIYFFSMFGEKKNIMSHDCNLDPKEEILTARLKKNTLVYFTKRDKRVHQQQQMAEQRKSKSILSFGKKNAQPENEPEEMTPQYEHCIRVIEGVSFRKCDKMSFGIIENLPTINDPNEVVIDFFYKEVVSDNFFDSATDDDMESDADEMLSEQNVQPIGEFNLLQTNTQYKSRNKLENLKIYLAVPNIEGVYIATHQGVDFRKIGVIKLLCLSPQQKYVAVYVEGFGLIVFDTDIKKSQDKFTTSLQTVPQQMVWCKNSMICMYVPIKQESKAHRHILLFVRTKDDIKPLNFNNPLHIEQDCDGVRIFMQHYNRSNAKAKMILWQKVPQELITLYTTNTEPGKKLYQFYKDYTIKGQSNINEMLAIENEMPMAVTTCLKAAAMSFDVRLQKEALRAASYGKDFINSDSLYFKHTDFDYYCRILRVLNALRQPDIGIIMSYHQFMREGKEKVIHRLTHRNKHFLSFKLCDYWNLHTLRALVLHHWACTKIVEVPSNSLEARAQAMTNSEWVDTTLTDDEYALVAVLKDQRDRGQLIYFADIAEHAIESNKLSLALNLCMLETNTIKQVPLLQRLGKHNLALDKAIHSFNTDVIYQVVLDLKNTNIDRVSELLRSNAEYTLARKLLISYCRQNDLGSLKQFYKAYQDQQYNLGMTFVHEYFTTNKQDDQVKALVDAEANFSIASASLETTVVQQQKTLLERQMYIDDNFKPDTNGDDDMQYESESFVGLSLNETIIRCIERGDAKLMDFANKLRKEFKVPDKRYWYLKISALARGEKWDVLSSFAKSKSPVGYVPFAKIAIAFEQLNHARDYIKLVNDPMDKIELYMQLGEVDAAISICQNRKSVELFQFANGLAPSKEGRVKLAEAYKQMNL